jgi:hypothetical protein
MEALYAVLGTSIGEMTDEKTGEVITWNKIRLLEKTEQRGNTGLNVVEWRADPDAAEKIAAYVSANGPFFAELAYRIVQAGKNQRVVVSAFEPHPGQILCTREGAKAGKPA